MKNLLRTRKSIFFLIIAAVSIFSLVGCGLGAGEPEGTRGSIGADENDGTTSNEDPNNNGVVELPGEDEDALWEKTNKGPVTGKWFMHNGSGVFGYTLPFGTKKAGDEVPIALFGHSKDGDMLERTVRVQLAELTDELEVLDVVLEKEEFVEKVTGDQTIFFITIPEKEDIQYLFSMEILGEDQEVEDTLVSIIKVPSHEINASLTTDKKEYDSSDNELTLTVENEGPTDLFFGVYYTIEKQVAGAWEEVILDEAFIDIAIQLTPGQSYEQIVDISRLEKGSYRFHKDVHADGLDLKETLTAEFVVK